VVRWRRYFLQSGEVLVPASLIGPTPRVLLPTLLLVTYAVHLKGPVNAAQSLFLALLLAHCAFLLFIALPRETTLRDGATAPLPPPTDPPRPAGPGSGSWRHWPGPVRPRPTAGTGKL
jgi:hypothetical protein